MFDFHGPGPVCLVLAMTSCIYVVCMSPAREIYSEASHWPSDHMTRSRPLIGQPSFPPTPTQLMKPRNKEFFRIGLKGRPARGPHSWLRIVDPTHSPNLFTRLVNPSKNLLKPWIRHHFFSLSGLAYKLVNLLVFEEKKSHKMSKNWTISKIICLGPNFTYEFGKKQQKLTRIGKIRQEQAFSGKNRGKMPWNGKKQQEMARNGRKRQEKARTTKKTARTSRKWHEPARTCKNLQEPARTGKNRQELALKIFSPRISDLIIQWII